MGSEVVAVSVLSIILPWLKIGLLIKLALHLHQLWLFVL